MTGTGERAGRSKALPCTPVAHCDVVVAAAVLGGP